MSIQFRGAWGAVFAAGLTLAMAGRADAAEYTLTVEPTYPAAQIREVYGPLVSYLNRSTGHRFTLRSPANFNQHWRELRAGTKTDFVFEEGHFFDYRRKRSGFIGLARTVENSAYSIAVADPEFAAEGRDGIIGRTVASLGAPNLGYVLVFDDFENPLAQPEVRSISSKWSDGPDLVFAGDVDGTLLPSYLAAENPALTEIWRSADVPGRVFSASPEVPQDVRRKVAEALAKLHDDQEAFAVINELRTERLVPVVAAEYDGMERLLINSFGYVPPAAANPASAAAPPAPAPAAAPAGAPAPATPRP
jgi:hypothetical protein